MPQCLLRTQQVSPLSAQTLIQRNGGLETASQSAGFTARAQPARHVAGTFAEYMLAESGWLARIPATVDFVTAAPILCAGVTVYKALKIAALAEGDWVAMVGAGGGLGHLGIQYARAMGLNVVALDVGRCEMCLEMGANVYIDVSESPDTVDEVVKATNGGVQGAIIVAPGAKAYSDAGRYLRREGIMVCVSLSSYPVGLTPTDFVIGGFKVVGSSTGSARETEEAQDFVVRGQVKPKVQLRRFDEIRDVIDDLEAGKVSGKAVVTMY